MTNRHLVVRNLDVRIKGRRPSSINERGDASFEASRAAAKSKFDQLVRDSRDKRHAGELVQTLHEIKTGRRIGSLPLTGLYKAWKQIPRRRKLAAPHSKWAEGVLKRFISFAEKRSPPVAEMAEVDYELALAFLATEEERGVAGRTYNAVLFLLKGAFHHLKRSAGLVDNPFDGIVSKAEESIHRIPFTPEDLKAILEAAQDDQFCRPLIVTGMSTAMRLGDVCKLKWVDVDLDDRFINVKTAKTGAKVSIPMFALLHDELARQPRNSEYCFPSAARMYLNKPDAVNRHLKKVFHTAGFPDEADGAEHSVAIDAIPNKEKRRVGSAKIAALTDEQYTRKVRTTMAKVFDLYLDGSTTNVIARKLHISKGSVSHYLHRIEKVAGFPVLRSSSPPPPKTMRGSALVKRENGLRRVNQRGFHAFRATWVTLALSANVPMEIVRRVTGHTVTQTVLDNYFQPEREQFRKTLETAMPKLLSDGTLSRDDRMREILRVTSADTWARDSKKLLDLMDGRG